MEEIHDESEQNLTFHYNRNERLSHAPKMVQDYYSGEYKMPPKGLFKMLVYTKSSRTMLFVLVACLLLTLFIGLMSPNPDEGLFTDVPVKLTAFSFQDTIYAQLVLKEPKDNAENYTETQLPVNVDFRFYDVDETLTESIKKEAFYEGKELAVGTTSADYDIMKVEAVVTMNNEQTVLKATVKRN
ncbi:MAG: hypothetical protein KBT02_13535 [Treponema sp.]|nr:hypothetical protein [Candidatus Treponema caballi]